MSLPFDTQGESCKSYLSYITRSPLYKWLPVGLNSTDMAYYIYTYAYFIYTRETKSLKLRENIHIFCHLIAKYVPVCYGCAIISSIIETLVYRILYGLKAPPEEIRVSQIF